MIREFTYHDKPRIAVELGPGKGGMLTMQLSPERGLRTFKPGKMMDSKRVYGLRWLYWYFRLRLGL